MKITINGDAYVITSKIKFSEFEILKKNNPEALRKMDEEGNDVFSIGYNAGHGNVSAFGITFSGVTRDDDKHLTLTGTIPASTADAKEFVADVISPIYAYLTELETSIPNAAQTSKESRRRLLDTITVA